ncbi:hypothetical protein [Thiobacillus denitrificans]|uniref:hypothetical protein n=1 Tax=Thiobacillus denitrificans TaxID=36861 RepID=UPI00037BEFD2|nr:hypothetical protein [Thiobacillus denitrificans]
MSAIVPEPASVLKSSLEFARCKIEAGLTEPERRSMVKFLMLLLNDSPKAMRLAKMFDRGEIDGDTLLKMMG